MEKTSVLTKTERLILMNQFLIRAKLEPDEAETFEQYAKALQN